MLLRCCGTPPLRIEHSLINIFFFSSGVTKDRLRCLRIDPLFCFVCPFFFSLKKKTAFLFFFSPFFQFGPKTRKSKEKKKR